MGSFIDLTGQRFGRFTVLDRAENIRKQTMWKCLCDCGKIKNVRRADLLNGKSTSCGCLRAEMLAERSTKHGMSETRLYREYLSIKDRCYREKCKDFPDYGGRGIVMCDAWLQDFNAFVAWALENGYRDDLTIDRIDTNGPYSPENCRWATLIAQARNKRSNRVLEYRGERRPASEWAEIVGISGNVLRRRIARGWSVERTLTEPVNASRVVKRHAK